MVEDSSRSGIEKRNALCHLGLDEGSPVEEIRGVWPTLAQNLEQDSFLKFDRSAGHFINKTYCRFEYIELLNHCIV